MMIDNPPKPAEKVLTGREKGSFKKGYDPRRWLAGRPKIPADQKKAKDIFASVLWDEFSRMIENKETGELTDALRLMVRQMIRNKNTNQFLVEFIAGKVKQDMDVTSGGEKIVNVIEIVKTYEKDNV
jgi:hypothetical protein